MKRRASIRRLTGAVFACGLLSWDLDESAQITYHAEGSFTVYGVALLSPAEKAGFHELVWHGYVGDTE